MKKNSAQLGFLLAIFVIATTAFHKHPFYNSQPETSPAHGNPNTVPVEKAQWDIAFYSWWYRYAVPNYLTYHKDEQIITFDTIPVQDPLTIELFDNAMEGSETLRIPVFSHVRPTRSIMIPKDDIVSAMGLASMMDPDSLEYSGIRVYSGLDVVGKTPGQTVEQRIIYWLKHADSISTHLFVVPVKQEVSAEGDTLYMDQIPCVDADSNPCCVRNMYTYDLTTPCPNSCDGSSILDQVWGLSPSQFLTLLGKQNGTNEPHCPE